MKEKQIEKKRIRVIGSAISLILCVLITVVYFLSRPTIPPDLPLTFLEVIEAIDTGLKPFTKNFGME